MPGGDEVTVLIPTLDEADAIGDVVDGFRSEGLESVLVIDGGSTDGTPRVAREHGAEVRQQTGTGKGKAVREGLELAESRIVVLVDGDGTYDPGDVGELLAPIRAGRAEHVIGDRFVDMRAGAMTKLNRVGNRLINSAFRFVHGREYGDILSGYRAFTRESAERMRLRADGFGIETEFAVECVKHDVPVAVVPITYRPRPGSSAPKLRPIRDGGMILLTLYRLAKTNNPLFYFGSIGVLSSLAGGAIAAYVGVEWVTRGVSHEVLAVVSAFAILFGVQLLMFGVLSDMILALHREQMRRIEDRSEG